MSRSSPTCRPRRRGPGTAVTCRRQGSAGPCRPGRRTVAGPLTSRRTGRGRGNRPTSAGPSRSRPAKPSPGARSPAARRRDSSSGTTDSPRAPADRRPTVRGPAYTEIPMSSDTLPRVHPDELEAYRRELTGYCYRMLGSGFEAEDAVQDTMLRAWRNADRFEGRASVRSWLYRIATNVCIDMHRTVQRRARPVDMGPSSPPDEAHLGGLLPEVAWVTPIPDERVLPERADPAEIAEYRESVRL